MTPGAGPASENGTSPGALGPVIPCHAPFANVFFARNGNMLPCCYNQNTVYGHWPETSIRRAWQGETAARFRERMRSGILPTACGFCRKEIELGKGIDGKRCFYDEYAAPGAREKDAAGAGGGSDARPRVFEFELHNTCNLECAMCFGVFSSAIRRNREQLPPCPPPYGPAFVDEVAECFPDLTDMKFLGGEPLLIDLYRRIWQRAAELKPELRIHITTSAGVVPASVPPILEKLNVGVVVSLDSLDPGLYARIRKNARLGTVLENLEYFRGLARRKGTFAGLAACPMTCNWREMPDLARFANAKEMTVFFNTVWGPDRLCLRFLEEDELALILGEFAGADLPGDTPLQRNNRRAFHELFAMLERWRQDSRATGPHLGRRSLRLLLREAESCRPLEARVAKAMIADLGQGLACEPQPASPWPALAAEHGSLAVGLAYLERLQKIREAACGGDGLFAAKMAVLERDLRQSSDPETFAGTLVQLGIRWCLDMIESGDGHMLIWRLLDAR